MKAFLLSIMIVSFLASTNAFSLIDIPKDLLKQRDPFKMPEIVHAKGPESELEMYSAADYKLIGVLAGGTQLRAMISAPNGKTYFVKNGMVIGLHKGVIKTITESTLVVREQVTNVLGDLENQDTVLKLPAETKTDVKTITSEQGW